MGRRASREPRPLRAKEDEPILARIGTLLPWVTEEQKEDSPEKRVARIAIAKAEETGEPDDLFVASDACHAASWEVAGDILRIRATQTNTRRRLAALAKRAGF